MDAHRFDAIARRLAGRRSRRSALAAGGAAFAALTIGAAGSGRRAGARDPPVCTDPARPGVGCACATGTPHPCGDTTLLCCANDPAGPPGAPGACTPAAVGCNPLGPPATPSPPGSCTRRGCRCAGGVERACDADLACRPDHPDLPGGPGRCVRPGTCNLGPCAAEGCACHPGAPDACDNGLVCCAGSSQPGGPGRCEAEDVCFAHQCQATTNPCPSACPSGANCPSGCSGSCGGDGPCAGAGCECATGARSPCDPGLVCRSAGGPPGGPGTGSTAAACGSAPDGSAGAATPVG